MKKILIFKNLHTNLEKIQFFFRKFYSKIYIKSFSKKNHFFLQYYEDYTILANDSNKNPFWGYNKKILEFL